MTVRDYALSSKRRLEVSSSSNIRRPNIACGKKVF